MTDIRDAVAAMLVYLPGVIESQEILQSDRSPSLIFPMKVPPCFADDHAL
jgi:hypothetical protein